VNLIHVRGLEFRAEAFSLFTHIVDQVRSLDSLGKSREIFDQGGHRELPAGLMPFQHERLQIRARRVNRGGQSGASGSHNDCVADFFHVLIDSLH
jgi:hypothetical protein